MSAGWDQSRFEATLKEYMRVTTRTWQTVANTKAFYIARKAIWFTKKADPFLIKTSLGQFITANKLAFSKKLKTYRTVKRREMTLVKSKRSGREGAPLAALIIQARQRSKGEKGLYGTKMARAIRDMLLGRIRSVAFLKSGWLPAVRILEPFADRGPKPPIDTKAKQIGRAKGTARPAAPTASCTAEIVNLATTRRDTKAALIKYGAPGLQRAFDDEAKSMWQYIEDKMRKDALKFNAAQKN